MMQNRHSVRTVIDKLEAFAPPSLARFDYVGVLVDAEVMHVTKIGLTLDPTLDAISKAKKIGCNFLITHHGPDDKQFHAVSGLDGIRIGKALSAPMTIYRMHLNLDFCKRGIQEKFCHIMGFTHIVPTAVTYRRHRLNPGGFVSHESITLKEAIDRVKRVHPETIRVVNPGENIFTRTLIAAGEGFVPSFMDQIKPDLFISGELNHIAIVRAIDLGITLIEATHASSECEPLKLLAPEFQKLIGIPVIFIPSKSQNLLHAISTIST